VLIAIATKSHTIAVSKSVNSFNLTIAVMTKLHAIVMHTNTIPHDHEKGPHNHNDQIIRHQNTKTSKYTQGINSPNGSLGFVRNPVYTNQKCYLSKLDVPDSMKPSKHG